MLRRLKRVAREQGREALYEEGGTGLDVVEKKDNERLGPPKTSVARSGVRQ